MYTEYDTQIDMLLAKMTLREKIGQLNQKNIPADPNKIEDFKEQIRKGEIGSVILATSMNAGNDPQENVDTAFYDEFQRIAVEESRHHIPLIYGRDVIHGHRTVYPVPLASASAFNPKLIEKCYRNIAQEAANDGIHWTFSPMLDLCRDPRWGRIIEGPGEDPYVGAKCAEACVKGFHGSDVANDDSLIACAKHYIGYGASEGGRDYHRTEISDYSLYNYYLPAFRAAIDAGIGTVMSSFNDINGQPVTSGKKYLTDILRGHMGFEGFVVSDWTAVVQLKDQGVAESDADCAELAVNAGLDMDMLDECYINHLEELVKNGKVSEDTINLAVKRILRIKFAKGLFNNPYRKTVTYDKEQHLADARELAAESMVLLKNDNVLPISKDSQIALFGPMRYERRALLGSWTLDGKSSETPNLYEAMADAIGKDKIRVGEDPSEFYNDSAWEMQLSDVVVLALGESEKITGENRAVADISLSAAQKQLIKQAKVSGKKVVGVFFCGRPIAFEDIAGDLDAILYAWHSGSQTANAVCDIIFGDTVPSGKTAITFPRKTGHIPLYYNVTSSGRPCNCYYNKCEYTSYTDGQATPYYPFGYGLSYTNFEYSKPIADKNKISLGELEEGSSIRISVNVKNIGDFDGKETVQLYIHDKVASQMRPMRELKAFKKLFIKKNESLTITFEIDYKKLGFYDSNGNYKVEPGDFDVFVGTNCLTENLITISVHN